MNKIKPLGQKRSIDTEAFNHSSELRKIIRIKGNLLTGLVYFASSEPDFRRTKKVNLRHRLADVIVLMIPARMSKCIVRA